jgi:hypothetical protein
MTIWQTILLASTAVMVLKITGYLVPQKLVERPTPARVTNLLTIALLSGLVAVQTLGSGTHISVDARLPAVLVAAGLLALRVPFIFVIISAAVVAALIRLWT